MAFISARHQAALDSPPAGGVTSCDVGFGCSETGFSPLTWTGPNTLLALFHSRQP